jgi:hypothetical protein
MTDELQHLIAIRADVTRMVERLDAVDARLDTIDAGQTVLGNHIMRLEISMERVKDLLGRMDARIARLERAEP